MSVHGNTGVTTPGGIRFTVKGRMRQAREDLITQRVRLALQRAGFRVLDVTQRYEGIRTNGINLRAVCGDYVLLFAVGVPGRKPDHLQRAALATDRTAVYVETEHDALRIASLGVLTKARPIRGKEK